FPAPDSRTFGPRIRSVSTHGSDTSVTRQLSDMAGVSDIYSGYRIRTGSGSTFNFPAPDSRTFGPQIRSVSTHGSDTSVTRQLSDMAGVSDIYSGNRIQTGSGSTFGFAAPGNRTPVSRTSSAQAHWSALSSSMRH